MKSFLNPADKKEIFERLSKIQPDSQRRWGRMTPQQMICHLSDSFKSWLGEKEYSLANNLFTRTLMMKSELQERSLNENRRWRLGYRQRPADSRLSEFLRELKGNNRKESFDANNDRYLAPADAAHHLLNRSATPPRLMRRCCSTAKLGVNDPLRRFAGAVYDRATSSNQRKTRGQ